MPRSLVPVWLCLLLIVLLPGSPPTAGAQTLAGPAMEAEAAFDGYVKYGEWLPIHVTLENNGGDLDTEVRVAVVGGGQATTYSVPVSLPAGSRKQVVIYALPNTFSRELAVDLVAGNEVLSTTSVEIQPRPHITFMAGLISPQREALSLLQAGKPAGWDRPMTLVDLSMSDLPEEAAALRSLDLIVFNDVDTTSLTPRQAAALEHWVQGGGRLVIGGGPGALRTAAGLPESLLPFQPTGTTQVDSLSALESVGGEAVRALSPFTLASGRVIEQGMVLASQDDLPMLVRRVVDQGVVDFVALDLTGSPFDGWPGTAAFWETLVLEDTYYPSNIPTDVSERQLQSGQIVYALSNLPSLALPSVQGLAGLLAVYIALVGPVNYLVLRRRGQLQLAWLSIPLITAVFSAGAFGLGYLLRGTNLIVNKIAVADLRSDGTTDLTTYLGIFSPQRESFEIEVAGPLLLSTLTTDVYGFNPSSLGPAAQVEFVQGSPSLVRGLEINQWSMQTFSAETVWPDVGRIAGDLHLEDGRLVGTIRNDTGLDLKDVALVLGNQFTLLDSLAPGVSAAVDMDLMNLPVEASGTPLAYRLSQALQENAGQAGQSREAQVKDQVLNATIFFNNPYGAKRNASLVVNTGGTLTPGVLFLGWFDEAPPELLVSGQPPQELTTGLLRTWLPYDLGDRDSVTVPPGLIPGAIVQMPAEGGSCGPPEIPAVYIARGEAVIEFQLPALLNDINAEQLVVQLTTDGGWSQAPETALYDWSAGAWAAIEDPALGQNILPDGPRWISQDGTARVRLFSNGAGACYRVELGLEGGRSDE